MPDEQTNKGDTAGKEADKPVENSEKDVDETSGYAMVDKANEAADRVEKATERLEKANQETARLDARRALGGRSTAGEPIKPKTQDELDREEANKILGAGDEDD